MVDTDTLLTIAEIAVAFAGFASIASAISARNHRENQRVINLRLVSMISMSLAVASSALLPVFFQELFETEAYVWAVSAGIIVIWMMTTLYSRFQASRKLESLDGFSANMRRSTIIISVLALCGYAANMTTLTGEHAYTIHLGSTLLCLLISGILFLRVVSAALVITEEES